MTSHNNMVLLYIIGFTLAVTGCHGFSLKDNFPLSKNCSGTSVTYGDYFQKTPWVCDESQYITPYPTAAIDSELHQHYDMKTYLKDTKSCQTYHDFESTGRNEYYSRESLCSSIRKPVQMVWAKVPSYSCTAAELAYNGGLMPCHVLQGQDLFELECRHPWSIRGPPWMVKRLARSGMKASDLYKGISKHFCLLNYNFSRHYMCRPDEFVTREVLVYSEHSRAIFFLQIPNVPTTCTCGTCSCDSQKY